MLIKRILVFILIAGSLYANELPFSKGFNLTWIWSNESAKKIKFSNYGKEDLEDIKSLGCDVLRFPLSLRYFTDDSEDRIFDPLFFYFLDQAVDMCEKLELYMILDNHTQFPNSSYVPTMEDLIPIWRQMAERYKDRSKYILYETFNEPHNISHNTWKAIQDSVIKTIRSIDSVHTIIVKPIWDAPHYYKTFEPVQDTNVIYSFHTYQPFLFTHQGALNTNPPAANLTGIPYPASAGELPPCPEDLLGTHFEDLFENYHIDGTDSAVFAYHKDAIDFGKKYNVPIMCDELGVHGVNAPVESRQHWHKVMIDHFTENNIPWTLWGYVNSLGPMKIESFRLFHHDLDPVMIENLHLIMPPQDTTLVYPDTTGFVIYHDHSPRHIIPTSMVVNSKLNYYSNVAPAQGIHCIKINKINAYQSIDFKFWAYRDLSDLVDRGASLKFSYKVNRTDVMICPRFRNTNYYSPDEPNWVNIYQLHENNATFDGQWHEASIPLSNFRETTITVNGIQYPPAGKFTWDLVDLFGFYLTGDKANLATLHLDNIRIELPGEEVAISNSIPTNFELHPIYPNPFNAQSTISFSLNEATDVKIGIHDIQGKLVDNFSSKYYEAGHHKLTWDASALSSGIYLIRMQCGNKIICRKAGLIK